MIAKMMLVKRAILTSETLVIADMTTCQPKHCLVCRTCTGKIRFKDNLKHILNHGWKGNYCLIGTPETSLSAYGHEQF